MGLNPLVKLHSLHGSVVPAGVTVLLGLYNPPHRGRGEPFKLGLMYSLVWIPCCGTVSERLGSRSRVGSVTPRF
jgi:cytochrome c biogenesis protein CcdA